MHIKEAWLNLKHARIRSVLTILSIFMGTAAIMTLMTLSELGAQHVLSQFKNLDVHVLMIDFYSNDVATKMHKEFFLQDADRLESFLNNTIHVAPYTLFYSHIEQKNLDCSVSIVGASETLKHILHMQMKQGRFVSRLDHAARYVVLGHAIAQKLKKSGVLNPIGTQILINRNYLTIIGVLKPQPLHFLFNMDIDQSIFVPFEEGIVLTHPSLVHNLFIQFAPDAPLSFTQERIKNFLHERMPNHTIHIQNAEELIHAIQQQKRSLNRLFLIISGIALIVGGMGVMNAMLISVIQRRREIGIRLAVGATQKDIITLFLMEAVALSGAGGILGMCSGMLISYVIAHRAGWVFYVLTQPMILSFCVSIVIGILAGFYPAVRAARLDPVSALQSND